MARKIIRGVRPREGKAEREKASDTKSWESWEPRGMWVTSSKFRPRTVEATTTSAGWGPASLSGELALSVGSK